MKKLNNENYLERVPSRKCDIVYSADKSGIVTLEIENKGVFNRLAQKLLKKPRISYIHLDENGSFVWQILDGKKTITEIGNEVYKKFGEEANPLYERLAQYISILESYGFIDWK